MHIKQLTNKLTKRFQTRNPIKIAECLGYTVLHVPLNGVRGFYQHVKRCHIIYLDDALPEAEACFVCAHELGHALLHKGCNRIFLDRNTYFVTSRYEKEADRFAVNLLYSDGDLSDLQELPISTVATCLGVSEELAGYRMGVMKGSHRNSHLPS